MKFNDILKKLKSSPQYESFSNAYKDAMLVAGFFVIDFENKKHVYQIDYYIPSKKKVAAFSIDHPVSMQMMDTVEGKAAMPELDTNISIELEALEGILDDEMKNRGISESLKKIVAVLHMHENKKLWNLNCMLSGMTILRAHIDDESKSVLKMEKVNLFDIMKTMPGNKSKLNPSQMSEENISSKSLSPSQKKSLIKEEVKKLDEIEKQIEKTKESLKKELEKTESKQKKK